MVSSTFHGTRDAPADPNRHCSLYGRIVTLTQDDRHLHYRMTWPEETAGLVPTPLPPESSRGLLRDDADEVIKNYFNLQVDLTGLYEQWSRDDAHFRRKAPPFRGIRILRQDAWEALIAFICSSNNNISRISQMVQKLCTHYGPYLGRLGHETFYDFPTPEALAGKTVEAHLRQLGFGYRAKYVAETARLLAEERPPGWLLTLRSPDSPPPGRHVPETPQASYRTAREALLLLSGVGPKVADCVCLMGLGWGQAVPVDTHVWQIAVRDYHFGKGKSKAMSNAVYDAVGDHFRQLWGDHAGWAQSVLFTANLKSFSEKAPPKREPSDPLKIEEVSPRRELVGELLNRELVKAEPVKGELVKGELVKGELVQKESRITKSVVVKKRTVASSEDYGTRRSTRRRTQL